MYTHNLKQMLKFFILSVCFLVGGPSGTTKRHHSKRNRGLDVERFLIENRGKKLYITFDEGQKNKAISNTYANFNNHIGSCVMDHIDPSIPR